jgi:phage terminase large subunit-like protein
VEAQHNGATRVSDDPALSRLVVAIDPAVTSGEEAGETGLVVTGRTHEGYGYTAQNYFNVMPLGASPSRSSYRVNRSNE